MKIDYDEDMNEYFLRFLDEDDRNKKSRFLKRVIESGQSVVLMSIQEDSKKPTRSQINLYKAFLIILREYTGHSQSEIKESIFSELGFPESDIYNYNREEFSEFIERLFIYCSQNVGLVLEMIDGKLTNMNQKE